MGLRDENKKYTREKIVRSTRQQIILNGFVSLSTKAIATASGVAQGSIFLHFESKNNLISYIVEQEMMEFQNHIRNELKPDFERDIFLTTLLDLYSKYEDMLSRVYQDFTHLDEAIKKIVEKNEHYVKNVVFDHLRVKPVKIISIVDSFIGIDAFMAQLKTYLIEKESFTSLNSVIKQRKGKLVKLFRMLFE